MNIHRRITRIFGITLLTTAALGLGACSDGILDEDPPHIIVPENLYTDLAGFQAGINALYAQVRQEREGVSGGGSNQIRSMLATVGVDNAFANHPAGMERIFNDWGVLNNPQEGFYLDIWSWLYQTVNAANTIIERADNPEIDWTEAQRNEILAEARVFRAWAYRHLTYLWGDVPLNLEESSGESIRTDWERTPRADVWAQMEQDLLFAEQHLPEVPSSPGRLGKAVARHYLAELYLAMDRPAEAEEKAAAVVNSGNYALITERYGVNASQPGVPFMDQFQDGNVNRNQGNTEALWVFQYQIDTPGGGQSIMRRYWVNRYYNIRGLKVTAEYGGRAIGRYANTAWAINLYEPQDDRGSEFAIRKFYLYNDPDRLPAGKALGDTVYLSWETEKETDPMWPSTRKWDWADPQDIDEARQYENQPYLRLAETYLLLAEAQMKQGKLAEAAENINVVRRRASASEIGPEDATLDFILDERSRELLTEEHRRYTLIRTGTLLERVREHNPLAAEAITERDTLYPIPQAVIDANIGAAMAQNAGY